jgi:hypothetical protein
LKETRTSGTASAGTSTAADVMNSRALRVSKKCAWRSSVSRTYTVPSRTAISPRPAMASMAPTSKPALYGRAENLATRSGSGTNELSTSATEPIAWMAVP